MEIVGDPVRERPLPPSLPADPFASTLASGLPPQTVSVEEYLASFAREIAPGAADMYSPRSLGHMTGVLPAFAGSISRILTVLNQNLVKVEASPTLTLIERQTLAMLHRLVFALPESFYSAHEQDPASTLGMMTGSGTISNITALWIARNRALSQAGEAADRHAGSGTGRFGQSKGGSSTAALTEEHGLAASLERQGYRDAVVIGSTLMHYSIEKAVALLGLGGANLIRIPTDEDYRIDLAALLEAVDTCRAQRRCVLAIVGVAGSTECGSIDSLPEMARIAAAAGAHFHVDAAWGGILLFSPGQRRRLAGIELADSVSFDGHKQMHLPSGTGMLLLRNPQAAQWISKQAQYILQEGSGDLGARSLEGSRDGASLFVHAALSIIGSDGYGALVDASLARTRLMADLIRRHPEFELIAEPQTNIVIYRYVPAEFRSALREGRLGGPENRAISMRNELLQKAQYAARRSYVSRTRIDRGGPDGEALTVLRAVLGNPFTVEADLRAVLDEQAALGSSPVGD